MFLKEALYGVRVNGTRGFGASSPTRAVHWARCQTGPVAFLAHQTRLYEGETPLVPDLFPSYVAAESERLGCGRIEVELPAG
ncbi:hypothetical protein [Streptomyces sp. NPDC005805]|uniref:hypothetical protein n=1 Tax=Streptomyces sp. NPDC005805 TaxID=3157068 RepID=UPI0033C945CF